MATIKPAHTMRVGDVPPELRDLARWVRTPEEVLADPNSSDDAKDFAQRVVDVNASLRFTDEAG